MNKEGPEHLVCRLRFLKQFRCSRQVFPSMLMALAILGFGPSSALIEMDRIAVLPVAADMVLSKRLGIDFDHDGLREFVVAEETSDHDPFSFYECTGNDTFTLVHVLDLENGPNDFFYMTDAGDVDKDGLSDLVVGAKDYINFERQSEFSLNVWESTTQESFPTLQTLHVVHDPDGWTHGGRIADMDQDGKLELVDTKPTQYFVDFEATGDNLYTEVGTAPWGPTDLGQSFGLLDDFDGDGRTEAVFGVFGIMYAVESTGDGAFEQTWLWDFVNPNSNVQFITDGGDLDGDGKKELLAGGYGLDTRLFIFEATGDNQIEKVATLVRIGNPQFYASSVVADVNGDGRLEIVFATSNNVGIYENGGDNVWHEIWSGTGIAIQQLGAGDHDQDGKDEIIFRTGTISNGSTSIYEIDPAYQADPDSDDKVDAIDNCPMDANPLQEDQDTDEVGDLCDNCVFGPNPGQGPAPLGQTLLASDAHTFSWSQPADVVYARGPLTGLPTYATDTIDFLAAATRLDDPEIPATSTGYWYLVKPDCPVGSWQSVPGAEPGRDVFLP